MWLLSICEILQIAAEILIPNHNSTDKLFSAMISLVSQAPIISLALLYLLLTRQKVRNPKQVPCVSGGEWFVLSIPFQISSPLNPPAARVPHASGWRFYSAGSASNLQHRPGGRSWFINCVSLSLSLRMPVCLQPGSFHPASTPRSLLHPQHPFGTAPTATRGAEQTHNPSPMHCQESVGRKKEVTTRFNSLPIFTARYLCLLHALPCLCLLLTPETPNSLLEIPKLPGPFKWFNTHVGKSLQNQSILIITAEMTQYYQMTEEEKLGDNRLSPRFASFWHALRENIQG